MEGPMVPRAVKRPLPQQGAMWNPYQGAPINSGAMPYTGNKTQYTGSMTAVPFGGSGSARTAMGPSTTPASFQAAGSYQSGGGPLDPMALKNEYDMKYNQARTDNLNRYNQGMQGYQDRYNRGMSTLEGLGNQELADIRQQGEGRKAGIKQNMTNLGLGGTTVGSSLAAGADRATNSDLGRAQERIRQQRLSTDANLSGDTLSFLERRNDEYPDFGSYASLMSSMGSAAGAYGGANPYAAGGGAGAAGGAQNPYASQENFGSTIKGDTGAFQPVFTKQPNGSSTMFNLTPLQMQLRKNPYALGG